MCVSCGCKKYDDDHGDERNITMDTLQEAAQAAGIPFEDVVKNIDEAKTFGEAQGASASGRRNQA
jgi:hypothetical protein